ncbi:OmpA family protein [Leptospira sarikeiensis]|uniref:OmpA-like domain-containing protein n=1 Tax=Leptospira sarikeiensis TaxID=2484943 RepID=A0A4R9K2G3_9LEPT|nr:OmpA family protein [Leptospira sarikeiensis]TGL59044.1 hypothetical protein EHQ64_16535 [Leptospira sarikeiensis]
MEPFLILICLLGGAALYLLIPKRKRKQENLISTLPEDKRPEVLEVSFYFHAGGAEIISSPDRNLKDILQTWKELENQISVKGWTDDYGTPAGNRKLSKDRAMEVKRFLEKIGIPKTRILVSFHGTAPESIGNKNKDRFRRVDCILVPQIKK